MSKPNKKELAEVLYGFMKAPRSQHDLARDIAQYLVAERRTSDLDTVLRELERLRLERDGVLEAVTTSAAPLDDKVKQLIRETFAAQDTRILERHDKSLVGGVYVQAYDKHLDLSVRGKLHRLKNTVKVKV